MYFCYPFPCYKNNLSLYIFWFARCLARDTECIMVFGKGHEICCASGYLFYCYIPLNTVVLFFLRLF